MSTSPAKHKSSNKRRHESDDDDHLSTESCSSNALHFKIDPKTGKQFKYSKDVERSELIKFIVVESLYNRSFEASLKKYVRIFDNPLEYSEELDRTELVKFICVESIFYTTSFMQSLTIYMRNAHFPEYKPISRNIAISEIWNQFRKYQNELIENFKCISSKVALAVNLTHITCDDEPITDIVYVCITAHWIDDNFVMHKRILTYSNMRLIDVDVPDTVPDESVDDYIILCILRKVVKRYCLDKKMFSVSLDNESYNAFSNSQLLNDDTKLEVDRTLPIKCACHVLNEIVMDGMTHLEPEIEKIRNAVRYIIISDKRGDEFSERCKSHNLVIRTLVLDGPTVLWNNTFDMLRRAMVCKVPLTEIYNESVDGDEDDNENRLNDRDWIICEEIVTFLTKFYSPISYFSAGAYYPTSNSILNYLNDIASMFFKYKDKPLFGNFLPDMKDKFIKCFIPVPPIYLIGTLFDPMMKLQHIEISLKFLYKNLELNYSEEDFDSQKQDLLNIANTMYSRYEVEHQEHRQVSNVPPSTTSSSSIRFPRFPGCEFWEQEVVALSEESRRSSNVNELNWYLQQQCGIDDDSDFDLLAWWRGKAKQFPVLSKMAQDVLAVPMSTVELERVFNQGKMELGELRCRLARSQTFKMMECLKDWVKAERRLQGLPEIDEEYINDFLGWDLFEQKCNIGNDDDDDESMHSFDDDDDDDGGDEEEEEQEEEEEEEEEE